MAKRSSRPEATRYNTGGLTNTSNASVWRLDAVARPLERIRTPGSGADGSHGKYPAAPALQQAFSVLHLRDLLARRERLTEILEVHQLSDLDLGLAVRGEVR